MKATIEIDDIDLAYDALEAAIPYLAEAADDAEHDDDIAPELAEKAGSYVDALWRLQKALAKGTSA